MSDFLALCKAVRRDCGISGDGPAAVTNQTGTLKKIVDWTSEAWVNIQRSRRDWRFMAASHAGSLSTSKQEYNASDLAIATAVLGEIDHESFYLGTDELPLQYHDYLDWRKERYGITPKTTKPQRWTINLAGNVLLDSIPDQAYTFTFDYRKASQILAANTDTPYMPADYKDAIISLAGQYYADYNEMAALSNKFGIRHTNTMTDLENDQSPTVTFPSSRFGRSR